MSLTGKQIDELRAYAKSKKGELAKLIKDAADTIEMLSAKLHASQMERSSQYYHGGWIPCSERLPEEDKNVLVTVYFMGLKQTHSNGWNDHIKPSYYVDIASHIDGEWSSASDEYKIARSRHKVIAWMPLPEPYKEDTDE